MPNPILIVDSDKGFITDSLQFCFKEIKNIDPVPKKIKYCTEQNLSIPLIRLLV